MISKRGTVFNIRDARRGGEGGGLCAPRNPASRRAFFLDLRGVVLFLFEWVSSRVGAKLRRGAARLFAPLVNLVLNRVTHFSNPRELFIVRA